MTKQTKSQDKITGNKTSEGTSLTEVNLTQIGVLISSIVEEKTKFLEGQINRLQEQVTVLTESNKDLIRRLTGEKKADTTTINLTKDLHDEAKDISMDEANPANDIKVNREVKKTNRISPDKLNKKKTINTEGQPTRRKRNVYIVGKNEDHKTNGDMNFSAAVKKGWVYVGRTNLNTTRQNVHDYLNKKYPDNNFQVEELASNPNAGSKSFKVGTEIGLLDELYKGENWPKGVLIKRFQFFRHKHPGKF